MEFWDKFYLCVKCIFMFLCVNIFCFTKIELNCYSICKIRVNYQNSINLSIK